MGKKGKKGKKEKAYVVDNVDTTSLTLKQLQVFCENVYKEFTRTELECRSLELERNKLKTMVELSNQELMRAKRSRRSEELELEQNHETNRFTIMEQQVLLRNVKNEKIQNTIVFKTEACNGLQAFRRDFDEMKAHIEEDMKELRDKIVQQDNDKNSKMIMLKQILEREKSNLLSETDTKLQASRYEKQMSEMSSKLKTKYTKAFENLNEYKVKKINEFLTNNDKLNISLQHYYEKLLQRNMTVLDGMHEKYKEVKDDVKQIQGTLKIHKQLAERGNHEIEANKKKIEDLRDELASSKSDQKKLKDTKEKLISKQKKLKNQQWDNLFLEEALIIMSKDRKADIQTNEKVFNHLKNRVMSEILKLECWAEKIMSYLTQINKIIKSKSNESRQDSSISLMKLAFAQLEEEAKEEEKQKDKTVSRCSPH